MFLTEQELVDLTHRVKGAWQARELHRTLSATMINTAMIGTVEIGA